MNDISKKIVFWCCCCCLCCWNFPRFLLVLNGVYQIHIFIRICVYVHSLFFCYLNSYCINEHFSRNPTTTYEPRRSSCYLLYIREQREWVRSHQAYIITQSNGLFDRQLIISSCPIVNKIDWNYLAICSIFDRIYGC